MTPGEVIIVVTGIALFAIGGQYLHARHEIRRHGQAQFEAGWVEGWDDREHDHYPETPEPQGRHHLSQPEDWIGNDLTEFLPPPPLPKRTPKATT